jgi:hypothetical protein
MLKSNGGKSHAGDRWTELLILFLLMVFLSL